MRNIYNRYIKRQKKQQKQAIASAPEGMMQSKEYKAMVLMNLIMNCYDDMIQLGYDPANGDEHYLNARFSAHAFMQDLINTLKINYYPEATESEVQNGEENKEI